MRSPSLFRRSCWTLPIAVLVAALLGASSAEGQASQHALRFFGTGVGPPGQQDRVLFAVDDNEAAAASTPADVGAGSFTLEFWLRGRLVDNATGNNGGDVETFDFNWIFGNIVLDRDVWCGSERKYGVSLAGGLVRFGTSTGDGPGLDSMHTMEGSTQVLDDGWHHVAVVRDVASGSKRIYVDGVLDFASSPGVSFADLSYPDAGVPVTPGQCGPGQLTPYGWYLVLGAEKHDAGSEFPSFNGFVDELRLWSVARTAGEIAATYDRLISPATPGLVAWYRFEEGSGTTVGDSSGAGSPAGDLVAGVPGNGQWVARAADPAHTAPILPGLEAILVDGFESGGTGTWTSAVQAP